MPLIKARARGKHFVRHVTRFERETNETLYAYAHFLEESPEYVLNQLVETVLGKDKEFLAWRTEHPGSYVPRRMAHAAHVAKRKGDRSGAHMTTHAPRDPDGARAHT
jgi:hypothetical protein